MKAVKVKDNIFWVGAIDFMMRSFHGYLTQRGSTYNAFLVLDEKITLIDTVKAPFTEEMLARIASVIDPKKIDYIIANHVEPDHSGAIPAIRKLNPNVKVVASAPAGVSGLKMHYGDCNYLPVKTGETLCTGKYTFSFLQTPMIHWPDNMLTYLESERVLFSNDSFGQHFSAYERFDYQCNISDVLFEAKKYYCNIVLPYSAQVRRALAAVSKLKIDTIAPAHGVIFTKHIPEVIELYEKLSSRELDDTATIVYDTMWGHTQKMAYAIADAFLDKDIPVKMYDLQNNHVSDVITDAATSRYLAVGSSTLNNQPLATMGAFLTYFKGLSCGVHDFIAFGSYGWSGQSIKIIHDEMLSLKHNALCEPIRMQYTPDLDKVREIVSSAL